MEDFITYFADLFEETEPSEFNAQTEFRQLDEWSSLIGLAALNMISKKYNVVIAPAEFRITETIESLYNLILSKKNG